jgi:hypothetical protein
VQLRLGLVQRLSLEENKVRNKKIAKLIRAKDVVTNTPRFFYNWTVSAT